MTFLVLIVLAVMLVVMIAGWLTVRATDDGSWTDVFWTFGTGATLAFAALASGRVAPFWREALVALLVIVWSGRLGIYIAIRVAKGPEDARYRLLREEWRGSFMLKMFGLLIVQAPATALLSISVLAAARNPAPGLRIADIAGAAILALSIFGEGVADAQMRRFKSDPTNHGKVCDTGLWAWSRHPNYLFEALLWVAYPVIAIDLARPWTFVSLIAPVVMFALLRYGTGVPPLEAAMVKSKGDAYRRYQERVNPFLPGRPNHIPPLTPILTERSHERRRHHRHRL